MLPALAATDHFDEAYLMLLRQAAPSWLYQVVQGATTVWERWDAIRPDGSIHPGTMQAIEGESEPDGHMLSFNHYAYGAVVEWVYRHVAGIAPDLPGYRRIRFAPRPHVSLSRARCLDRDPVRSRRDRLADRRGRIARVGGQPAIRHDRDLLGRPD